MITVLCPTYGRPDKCKRMIASIRNTATTNIEVLLCTSNEDTSDYSNIDAILYQDKPYSTVACSNFLSQHVRPETTLIMVTGDDTVFATPNWDLALLSHYEKLENKIHVYHLLDSRGASGTPHPIVTQEFMKALGYFMTPIFLHLYVDTWTVEIAKYNNCFTHMKDYLLIHDKCTNNGNPADNTRTRMLNKGWFERDEYVNETCGHFLQIEKDRLRNIISNVG